MRPTDSAVSTSRPLRILVVDDNADVVEMTAEMLKMYGHEALTAEDGPSALAVATRERPDVVLLDLGLPGMHGFEVAEALRAGSTDGVPMVIAVSGYGRAEDRERSRAAGCAHHLVKPMDFDRLLELLAAGFPQAPSTGTE